jgi:hypothetical protein
MKKLFKEIITLILVVSLINTVNMIVVCAQEKVAKPAPINTSENNNSNLDDLTLPADLGDFKLREGGAVFYSPTIKNRVLIPIYFWGEVQKAGLHYLPVGTSFVKGLSIAGGPSSMALMTNVRIIRTEDGKTQTFVFDLLDESKDQSTHDFILRPSDVVRIDRDDYFQNRAYYTSLIGIGVTILSGILTFQAIQKDK